MTDWPGAERRRPPHSMPTYAVRAPLARWLEEEAGRQHERRGAYSVLDVGCGNKPYLPFFEPYVSKYVGVDVVENPAAELRGPIEALPVDDGSHDLVLALQVLEHVDDPGQAVRELRRVAAPGGTVLISTHGVQAYHPSPVDYWRWTRTGLEKLFRDNGDWASVSVTPASGTAACVAMVLSLYIDLAARRSHAGRALARPLVSLLNRGGEALDRRSSRLGGVGPGTLHANYHVTAEVPE